MFDQSALTTLYITKTKALLPPLYTCSEHKVMHNILKGNIDNEFMKQNALGLSSLGVYHWQQGTGYLRSKRHGLYMKCES